MTPNNHRANFTKLIRQAAYAHSTYKVFYDFITLLSCSISNTVDRAQAESREELYCKTIKKYEKKVQELFPQMAVELVEEMEEHAKAGRFTDVLGEVFHELELHSKWHGQFFTPQHLADMMGMMVCDWGSIEKAVRVYGYASVCEPAAGSGAMLYGFLNGFYYMGKHAQLKLNHSEQVLMVAQDIDERCVMMSYIQLSLYGVPAIVERRNSLTMELFDTWYTPLYILGGWRFRQRHKMQVLHDEKELAAVLEV